MYVQVAERSGYAHQQRGDGEGHQNHGRPLWQACRPVSITGGALHSFIHSFIHSLHAFQSADQVRCSRHSLAALQPLEMSECKIATRACGA